jgi:hypothetical protein
MKHKEYTHEEVRSECVEYMINNRNLFEPFMEDNITFDKYIDNISKTEGGKEIWGGPIEIIAMSQLYDLKFEIWTINEKFVERIRSFADTPEKPSSNIIRLLYNGSHYDGLLVSENLSETNQSSRLGRSRIRTTRRIKFSRQKIQRIYKKPKSIKKKITKIHNNAKKSRKKSKRV